MDLITCFGCNTGHPQEQTVQISQQDYCRSCSEQLLTYGEIHVKGAQEAEPPIPTCALCKKEFADNKLEKLGSFHICTACKTDLNKQIFPLWVKAFFAGVLALVVFSIFWNWRFFAAYQELNSANKTFSEGKMEVAATTMKDASENVPEVTILADMAHFYKGISYLSKDKSALGLVELNLCSDSLPADYHLRELKLQAQIGAEFDRADYQAFLNSSKDFLKADTTLAGSWGGVASAYACLYAQKGTDSLKKLSLYNLKRSRAIDDTSTEAKNYSSRILYRLDSRQIISKDQFDKKFPNGYTSK
ncbi:hypothetical protein A0256_16260 [Mucilaginibacter sp. PAMC 26640]|nr:hypothetical protein A0256_16260 [Mucilaginibacter sp. PAMC 26640]